MKTVKAVAPYIHPEFLNFKTAPKNRRDTCFRNIGGSTIVKVKDMLLNRKDADAAYTVIDGAERGEYMYTIRFAKFLPTSSASRHY